MGSLFERAEMAISEKDFPKALHSIDSYLKDYPNDSKAYLVKSIALQRLKRYDEATQSISLARQLAVKKGDPVFTGECDYRMAIVLFNQKRYVEAKKAMDAAQKSGFHDSSMEMWTQMIDRHQAYSETLDPRPAGSLNKGITSKEVSSDSSEANPQEVQLTAAPVSAPRYDFYQDSRSLNISLFVKGLSKEKTAVAFSSDVVVITSQFPDGSKFEYCFSPLYGPIDADSSKFRVFGTKLELTLIKAESINWKSITKSYSDAENASGSAGSPLTDAGSSNSLASNKSMSDIQRTLNKSTNTASIFNSGKNWDQLLDKEIEEEEKGRAENDPAEFFKEIYKNADADTQRAMMKSYYESNGTTLSTNWDSVGKGKVDTVAPDGMESKKW